jgi:hypothetical protein
MSKQEINDWIRKQIANNDVVVFMKGTKQFPQCGFSGQVAQILGYLGVDYQDVNVLDDMSVRDGIKERIPRRVRHRQGDVPRRLADAGLRGKGCSLRQVEGDDGLIQAIRRDC